MSMPDVQEQGMYGYFLRELDYLRTRAKDFSSDYPRVAEDLKLSQGKSSDPHVELLLQSFAYLAGSIRQDMDNEACHLPNQLLSVLYPHLVKPLPSMMVVQPTIIADGANFEGGWPLHQGREFYVEVAGSKGTRVRCCLRNCYETVLRPLTIENIAFVPVNNFEFSQNHSNRAALEEVFSKAHAVLKLHIINQGGDPIHSYGLDKLRFYIHGEPNKPNSAYRIYTTLVSDLFKIALVNKENGHVQLLSVDKLRWLGFNQNEAVLPYSDNSHQAYRILQEYFTFPEKFLFFEIDGIDSSDIKNEFEILFLLDSPPDKSITLKKDSFLLNALPLINLYQTRLHPIRLDEQTHEYRLMGDVKNHSCCEIHSIIDVTAIPKEGRPRPLLPYVGVDEYLVHDNDAYFSTRVEISALKSIAGTETYMAFHKSDFNIDQTVDDVISVNALCTNRRLAETLRIGDRLHLQGAGPISTAHIVSQPTNHRPPSLNGQKPWRLISNMSLNYLSLNSNGLDAFKSILLIYSLEKSKSHFAQINSIMKLSCSPIIKRIGKDQWRGFCKGTEVSILIDQDVFDGGSVLLFGEVLRRFLSLYANVNSFVQLKLNIQQKTGVFKTWEPLAGEQIVL